MTLGEKIKRGRHRYLFACPLVVAAAAVAVAFTIALVAGRSRIPTLALPSTASLALSFAFVGALANAALAVIAWYALRFARAQAGEARRQAVEAEQTRAASLMSEIRKSWLSSELVRSRQLVADLDTKYQALRPQISSICESSGEYISAVLIYLRGSSLKEDKLMYGLITDVLDELELIGTFCRMEMLKVDHILEIFGGQVIYFADRLRPFCHALQAATRRQGYKYPQSVYANALWLFEKSEVHAPFAVENSTKACLGR